MLFTVEIEPRMKNPPSGLSADRVELMDVTLAFWTPHVTPAVAEPLLLIANPEFGTPVVPLKSELKRVAAGRGRAVNARMAGRAFFMFSSGMGLGRAMRWRRVL